MHLSIKVTENYQTLIKWMYANIRKEQKNLLCTLLLCNVMECCDGSSSKGRTEGIWSY